jgi:hypothetical protein
MGVWQPWSEWREIAQSEGAQVRELRKTAGQWVYLTRKDNEGNETWTPVKDMARPQPACEALPTKD